MKTSPLGASGIFEKHRPKRVHARDNVTTIDSTPHVVVSVDTLPGRAKGRGFGLSVQVISDHSAANTPISNGSFGWDGAFGTHFWVDPKEKIVGLFMVQAAGPDR